MFSLIFILWLLYIVYALLVGNITLSFLPEKQSNYNLESRKSVSDRDSESIVRDEDNMFMDYSQRHRSYSVWNDDD